MTELVPSYPRYRRESEYEVTTLNATATPEQITLVRGLFAEREIPNAVEFLGAVEDSIENDTLTSVWARDVLVPSLKRRPYTAEAIADWQSTRTRTTGGRSRPELHGDRVIPYGAGRAVGRFNPDGPTGFTSSLGGPVRATRSEAVGDYIMTLDADHQMNDEGMGE